jgi:hypothetical protein
MQRRANIEWQVCGIEVILTLKHTGKGCTMQEFLRHCVEKKVVFRALKFTFIVGTILIIINYGDAILRGSLTPLQVFKMALTVVVPYVVSTVSSVGAIMDIKRNPR